MAATDPLGPRRVLSKFSSPSLFSKLAAQETFTCRARYYSLSPFLAPNSAEKTATVAVSRPKIHLKQFSSFVNTLGGYCLDTTQSGMNFLYWCKISHIRHSETEASSSSRFVTPTNSSDLAHFARQLRTNNTYTVSSALSLCQPTTEAAEEDYHHATRAQHSHTHSLTVEPPKMEGRKRENCKTLHFRIRRFKSQSCFAC